MERTPHDLDSQGSDLLDRLLAEHHALERRLAELDAHLSLTPAEQVERARIKKLKLATKDRIAMIRKKSTTPSG